MSDYFEKLEPEDVVHVGSERILIDNPTFMVKEFIAATREMTLSYLSSLTNAQDKWFFEGVDCKILKPGIKGWQKGKVRLTLEFCPDESEAKEISAVSYLEVKAPESPLDDIRQRIPKE